MADSEQMIAAISPADYDETLSTLRYADQAKKIKNRAVVNEDPNAKLIRELKEELATLRMRVTGAAAEATYDPSVPPEKQVVQYKTKTGEIKTVTKAELVDQIEASEKLMSEVNQTWEQKLVKTQEIQKAREHALEELGITIEKNLVGVYTPRKVKLFFLFLCPFFLWIDVLSRCLIWSISTRIPWQANVFCSA
jgi:kinesin family protein 1